jgi:hypothetical protein
MDSRFKTRVVVAVLIVYGVYSTVAGLWMLVAPASMFATVGGYGTFNPHYVFDLASFELPLGLLYFAAIRWPSWRVPTLAFATLHYVLHSISHLIDIGSAAIPWVGEFLFIALATGTLVHAIALRFAVQVAPAAIRP